MTRHTRNRQLQKLNSALAFNTTGCNIPIELSKKHVCYTDLDRLRPYIQVETCTYVGGRNDRYSI